ncbi:tyrosine--tRNA ligase [candidate division WOR-1 bacterium RIFOXYA12_FULL_52_29]|uniref:Tyrosine--tRNA ligase n=1 Tax=candidate division WOR-1 bacterium RIFOXYC12_FULL_54_18 TaxID=1802584 RepID=A0A1F4T627_UNCSA|nr:MAG: tyrosine--tRNA ligase [candidate division WOR-1 bacterium RIFOXYA2_FULL_51_19]OGC17106.1 MAG: tyrosine--tRNA ligase [candidate division WOR-1 bacterium RIFOXYA12_FULL_52_29]OGC25966.1 MAG: tyrosine--tRNA ligase [candidate division WOR-1 bacterium RIFOXYB2_FULL_45_9]OGC27523.1 MAG: tyrosine--tRNA ligase [candidate division WOR-1 bacterium RIFOXYC12_FULL_54_18]OGC29264.1 MAG: tyrosine--tRNA ligase [candidate division WOR-1 bacterium RIFOXYB12_FULL_52_16]
MKSYADQLEIIRRGAVEIIPESELIEKLKLGLPLRVKFGADPSAPDIHLGHTVVLNKLRQFQDLGHHVIFLIGDFTAMIGDPTGKSETRKPLSKEQVEANAGSYKEQIFKILDKHKTEIVYNSHWLEKMSLMDVFKLSAQYTVARMLERKDFAARFEGEKDISILEFLYPLLQGHDSVHLKADIEIGGTDQKFNLLMGRTLQQKAGQTPQVVLTMPLLEGTDGVQKMSKSLGNYIGITDPPSEIFGKTMSISDPLMLRYYELLTDEPLEEIKALHPMEAKKRLARRLVARFYDKKEAAAAEESFTSVFKKGEVPREVELFTAGHPKMPLLDLLTESGLAPSRSEAKRLVQQGGVSLDGKPITDEKAIVTLDTEKTIKVGKRKFLRVKNG